jgi:hypothetical protein
MAGSNVATPPIRQETATPDWAMAEAQEFFPHQFDASSHSQLVGFHTPLSWLEYLGEALSDNDPFR